MLPVLVCVFGVGPVVTARVPAALVDCRVIPLLVSVSAMLLPVDPTVRKSTFASVIFPPVVPVPALRVTTVPDVLAVNAAAPWEMLPLTD